MRPARRAVFILVTLLVASGIGLGGLELVLRGFRIISYPPSLFQYDAERGWALRPGEHAATPYAKDLEINSAGLRGREIASPKPGGLFRILMLGDSITFGSGVAGPDTLPRQIERVLDNPAVDVCNAGVPGYNTYQEFVLLRDVGIRLEPDLVLLCFFHNDIEPYRPRKNSSSRALRDAVRRRLYAYTFLQERFKRLRALLRPPVPPDLATVPEHAWERARVEVDRIVTFCQAHGIRLAVLYVGLQREPAMDEHLQAWCAAAGVPYYDVHAVYAGRDMSTLWVSPRDGHPNAEGHRLAAIGIARFLNDTPVLGLPSATGGEDAHA